MSPEVHRNGNRRRAIASTILLGAGLTVFGCSGGTSLTRPEPRDRTSADDAGGGGDTVPALPATIISPSKTEIITTDGGRVTLGPYTVNFSPGALETDTEIRVVDLSKVRGYPCVELFPEGIKFDNTVTLEIRIPPGTDTRGYTMWWWGLGTDGAFHWIDVGGKVSADGTTLSTVLQHFSTYAPGKAGWWKPQNPLDPPRAEQGGHR